ncbi:MAG: ABC transporter substrate-binding protein, partial [Pseudomonadota bacterium]
MRIPKPKAQFLALGLFLVFIGCHPRDQKAPGSETVHLVFKHGKIAGDPAIFRDLLNRFEKLHPGIKVKDETLPASTDEQHQFYVINLEGGSSDFDVLSLDVIWVPEFARAGWLRDLSGLFSEGQRKDFFSGPMEAVTFNGSAYACPWYIDAGVLYYRKDLLQKYGFSPPVTWPELVSTAQTITAREKGLVGFVWQGKQYEGLVCNVLEYIWSNGGEILKKDQVCLLSPENIQALRFMKDLIHSYKITPPLVTPAPEASPRQRCGNGRAWFMRTGPSAWTLVARPGSADKGRVGISSLPSFPGHQSASTLGGWQLGINAFSKYPLAAEKLVLFLTGPEAQ